MKHFLLSAVLVLGFGSNILISQVSIYPDVGMILGEEGVLFSKPNMIRLLSGEDLEVYDIAVDNQGRLSFYPNGLTDVLAFFDDDNKQFVIQGDENSGTTAGFRITNGGQTLIMDGNEIDALVDGLNLNFNSPEEVTLAKGGGGVSINRGGPPANAVDVHLKQGGNSDVSGGMTFENSSNADSWKIYHSGVHFSFGEKEAASPSFSRRAYVESVTGDYVQLSDGRFKENIKALGGDLLSKVIQLKPKIYNYKSSSSGKTTIGFIAQDVQKVFPELVSQGEDGFLGLAYANFGVISIGAIQELNEKLEKENSELRSLIEQLIKRIEILEQK